MALTNSLQESRFTDLRAVALRLQKSVTEHTKDTILYSNPEPSTYKVTLERLRNTQRQKERHEETQREKTVSLYLLGEGIPIAVISIALPLFVMFGFLLIAMCLSYVRDKVLTLRPVDQALAVDVGLVFTELRKSGRRCSIYARIVLPSVVVLPLLSAISVNTAPQLDSSTKFIAWVVIILAAVIAISILRDSYAVSGLASANDGATETVEEP